MKLNLLLLAVTAALCPPAWATEPAPLRDPMQPPPAVRAATATASPGAATAATELPTVRHLLVTEGRRQLVLEGGRRLAAGDRLGEGRIERIDDSAVFLRTPAGLQRLPLFVGVSKLPASEAGAAPLGTAPTAPTASTASALAALAVSVSASAPSPSAQRAPRAGSKP